MSDQESKSAFTRGRANLIAHPSNAGTLAAGAWLTERGLRAPSRTWDVEIGLDVVTTPATIDFDERHATRFQLLIYAEEWGFRFTHAGQTSWIRVTDISFIHGRDDHRLLEHTPPLKRIGSLIRELEKRFGVSFERQHAAVRTTIPNAEVAIRGWIVSL
jgi:hypothetical protein